jgi:hypothetical protein
MILATRKVEGYARFLEIFSTKGAEKRRERSPKGVLGSAELSTHLQRQSPRLGQKVTAAIAASVAASPRQRRLAGHVLLSSLSRPVARVLRDSTP